MNKLSVFILFFIITACVDNKKLNTDFFYNTSQVFQNKLCNNAKNQWTCSFKLDSLKVIYACNQNNFTTIFYITDNDFSKVYDVIYFPSTRFDTWTLTYDNKSIIAIKENLLVKENKELVTINLMTKELKSLSILPYNTYWFSKHPLSENGVLTFNANINNGYIFDINTNKLNNNLFKCQNNPIISKDGKSILFVLDKDVFFYHINTKRKDKIYSYKDKNNFNVFDAYFGNQNEVIVKGILYPDIKLLEGVEYHVIKNKRVTCKGQIDFRIGYRYY